jgi:hypothetical protein
MIKFFLALVGIATATLVGTFVLAGLTIQAGQLVALRPVSTSVEIRGPPVLSTHSVHTVAQQHSEETKGSGFGSPDPAITWRPIRAQRELNK